MYNKPFLLQLTHFLPHKNINCKTLSSRNRAAEPTLATGLLLLRYCCSSPSQAPWSPVLKDERRGMPGCQRHALGDTPGPSLGTGTWRSRAARGQRSLHAPGLGELWFSERSAGGVSAPQPGSAGRGRCSGGRSQPRVCSPSQRSAQPRERRAVIVVPCSSDRLVHHKRMLIFVSL